MLNTEKWLEILGDQNKRKEAYKAGRAYVKSVTGFTKNACAATCSYYIRYHGNSYFTICINTKKLLEKLTAAGFEVVGKQEDWRKIQPGDVLFAQDKNYNNMPDHVCIAVSYPDSKSMVKVVDNYTYKVLRRNMLKGRRTPLDYFMRFNVKANTDVASELTDIVASLENSLKGAKNLLAKLQ